MRIKWRVLVLVSLAISLVSCEHLKNDTPDEQPVLRWLAVGNSITLHNITSFWWGEWGMAASTLGKDWVHLLDGMLAEQYKTKTHYEILQVAAWEKNYASFDKSSFDERFPREKIDIVVIRLGENVNDLDDYENAFREFVQYIKKRVPNATGYITGNFFPNAEKDIIHESIAKESGYKWISLDGLCTPENRATLDTRVFGDDKQWHLISDGGDVAWDVARHPGDKGMNAIAERIFKTILDTK